MLFRISKVLSSISKVLNGCISSSPKKKTIRFLKWMYIVLNKKETIRFLKWMYIVLNKKEDDKIP